MLSCIAAFPSLQCMTMGAGIGILLPFRAQLMLCWVVDCVALPLAVLPLGLLGLNELSS
jgi:hypothetical protein